MFHGGPCLGPGCFRCELVKAAGGAVVRARAVAPASPCKGCKGEEEWGPAGVEAWAQEGGPELLPGVRDPLNEPVTRTKGWAQRKDVRERHVAAFRRLLGTAFPSPEMAEGDGVVVCGGGRLWPGIVASVRLLRQVSNLPVQLWYRGFGEPVDGADLAGVPNVTYHDGEPYLPRIAGGWEIKTAALLNCGLWRAVLLDADAYFVADPRPFLDLATSETPFVFWQDLHSQKNSVTWAAFGLSGSNGVPPIQGGHVAVDLLAWRRELVLSHWLSQHSDYFYQFGFGDQDMHRAALAATGGRYRNLGMVGWKWPIYTCSLDGKPVICHRCRAKCYEPNGRTRYPGFPGEDRYLTAIEGVQEPDAYAVDARHRDMIRDELMTGRYKRVLEIGCHDGYSTQAFIDALRVGKVEEVHLCDVAIRPKVRELVRGLAGVTVHERPSLGVLERERYDLVFVDGDHTGPNCEAEARLLLDAGTAAVFAHDSKGMSGDGPPKLAALFRAAGYRCWEDAEQRPGERTHRGLFFAARPGVSTTRLLERSEV